MKTLLFAILFTLVFGSIGWIVLGAIIVANWQICLFLLACVVVRGFIVAHDKARAELDDHLRHQAD